MSLGAELRGTLAELRTEAESLMLDTCKVERPGKAVPDGRGGTTRPMTLLYEGKCKAQHPPQAFETTPEAGGHEFSVQSAQIHLPVGAVGARVNDVITVTASAHDPHLAGRTFRVSSPPAKSFASADRLGVVEIPD